MEAAIAVEDKYSTDISVVTTKQVGDSSVTEIKTVKTFTISKAPLPENAKDLSVTVQDEKVSMVHTYYGHTLAIAKARNISDDSPDNILIEVLDEDIGKDDNMGNLSLNGLDLIEKQSLVNQWMPLSDGMSGETLISVETHKTVSG